MHPTDGASGTGRMASPHTRYDDLRREDSMDRLAGQVAIVTGGATGIGGATARRLAEEGARVLIADVNLQVANENVDRIKSAGGTAEVVTADVGRHADIKAMVEK